MRERPWTADKFMTLFSDCRAQEGGCHKTKKELPDRGEDDRPPGALVVNLGDKIAALTED